MEVCLFKKQTNTTNTVIGRQGMLLSPQVLKSPNNIEKIQPRMMYASFNGNPSTTIISYANDETVNLTFYNELPLIVRYIPKHNVLIIGGDINTQINKDKNQKICLHNSLNRKWVYLTKPLLENRLTCLNT